MQGRANEGDALQVWRENRPRRNSGNRAGMIKRIWDRCGGKIRRVRGTRKNRTLGKGQKMLQNPENTCKTYIHTMKLKWQDHDRLIFKAKSMKKKRSWRTCWWIAQSYPEGELNVFAYLLRHGAQYREYRPRDDTRGKVRGSTKAWGFILWRHWMYEMWWQASRSHSQQPSLHKTAG